MNNISNLRVSEGDVLKSTVKVALVKGIKNMRSGYCRKFGLGINRVGAGLQTHVNTRKNIKSMLSLR
jgi:hypothetical protein